LVVGAANGVYESDDQGDTVTAIAPGVVVNTLNAETTVAEPMAYGVAGNEDLLYVGSGDNIFIRTSAHPAPLAPSVAYPRTGRVVAVAVPRNEPNTAFVIDPLKVYRTPDRGATWADITGGLMALGGTVLHTVIHCADLLGGSVVVGTNAGVFAAPGPTFSSWSQIGSGLPTVPVLRLKYSASDRVLLAGTLGRGAWTLHVP
jgi:hypothetical protein